MSKVSNTINDIKPILIPGAIAIGIFVFGSKLLEALGLKTSKEDTQVDAFGKADYWNPQYWNTGSAHILTQSSASTLAKQIHDAIGIFTDDESSIMAVFHALAYKTQISFLAYTFQNKYKEDLFYTLKQNLTNDEMLNIKQITDALLKGK